MEDQLIKEILKHNGWLNGTYLYQEGDVMAIVNQPEKFQEPQETADLKELYSNLRNYDGVFKYGNLLFFNDWQFGTFVYDINGSRQEYVEHLSMDAITYEAFVKIIEELKSKSLQ